MQGWSHAATAASLPSRFCWRQTSFAARIASRLRREYPNAVLSGGAHSLARRLSSSAFTTSPCRLKRGRRSVLRMLGVRPADRAQIRAGGQAGERSEVLVEVGLVEIACLVGELGPSERPRSRLARVEVWLNAREDVLQTVQTGQRLGRCPH